MKTNAPRRAAQENVGKLRIGDNWNAIRIIAFSQSNPLKAVAEFVGLLDRRRGANRHLGWQ